MKGNTFESLKFISETHRALHAKRQQYEWRIIFTVLSFYVLSVAAVYSKEATNPDFQWFKSIVWGVFITLSIISSIFLWYVHNANAKNKSYAEEAEKKLVEYMNTKKEVILEFSNTNVRIAMWAFIWQTSTLLLVAIASSTFITSRW